MRNRNATARGLLAGLCMSFLLFILCNSGQTFGTGIIRKLHEEEEGGEHGHGSEGEEEVDEKVEAASITCIIVLLIFITIAFETFKEHIEEGADKTLKPIIASMFGEMTVLGFLSACTFVLVQSGVFEHISIAIFGESEEELLVEIFEQVHFALFFIMIIFVMQVLVLVKEGTITQNQWKNLEKKCKDAAYVEKIKDGPENKEEETALLFYGLRSEFIKERSTESPFKEKPTRLRLPESFNFGRYLSLSFGNIAAHVVHVHAQSWAYFILLSLIMFVLMIAVDVNITILAWIWLGFGWAAFCASALFMRYLDGIAKAFAATTGKGSGIITYGTEGLLPPDDFPAWCKIDMEEYMSNRSWLTKMMCHHHPSRQNALFLFEREGPEFHLLFFQISLIFVGLYGALLALVFFPEINLKADSSIAVGYTILAVVPVILMVLNMRELMATLSIVGSIGSLRNAHFVSAVIREEQTARVVRAFLVLEKMHRFAKSGIQEQKTTSHDVELDDIEMEQIGKTFDALDKDSNGTVARTELENLLKTLGSTLNQESMGNLTASLDSDGDDNIEKDEFIKWYKKYMVTDDLSIQERAHSLFEMFDQNGSGTITIGEFKETLDAFNLGFSIDEVGEIVKALDEDGDVQIGLEEFEELIEKYYHDSH
mmetsp:Transcript_1560/g.2113  ORF Transcript_1560/g.2113 Transcript_1560/m.2113 type:complete len:654 (-) Transcript_1560:321-2282(-)